LSLLSKVINTVTAKVTGATIGLEQTVLSAVVGELITTQGITVLLRDVSGENCSKSLLLLAFLLTSLLLKEKKSQYLKQLARRTKSLLSLFSKGYNKMTHDELNSIIQQYVDDGGEIVKLRYASEKDQKKAHRSSYHKDKAIAGNERSKNILDNQKKREESMVFSKIDRWRE
jgi:hypothetical protein